MANILALLGLLLMWASLLWMPLASLRAVQNRGGAQTWSLAAILTCCVAFGGFTRALAIGTAGEAFIWSITWVVPFGLALFARSYPDAVFRTIDIWLGAIVLLTFMMLLPQMPAALRGVAEFFWA